MKFIPLRYCLLFFSITQLPAQTTFFVNHSASGTSDGSSWANAFIQFQQALAVAQDGDEIWVAKGTYKPATNNDRAAFYNLPSGVKVYGGFAGTEILREQRDWAVNLTILSGDIGVPGDTTDNTYTILYANSPNQKTLLDGLIIEEGNANNTDPSVAAHRPSKSGGGIYVDGENFGFAQLSVKNCTIRRNRASYQGGGLYANGRDEGVAIARLENCLVEQNMAKVYGGGLSIENYFEQPFELEVKACEFRSNFATSGSACRLRAHQVVRFLDCKFTGNLTRSGGRGVVYFMQMESNHLIEFTGCTFEKNDNYTVYYDPNIHAINKGRFKFKSCVFAENGTPTVILLADEIMQAEVENCLFRSNKMLGQSSSQGIVGVSGVPDEEDSVIFTNNLFYNNIGLEISAHTGIVTNCIIIDVPTQNSFFNGVIFGQGNIKVSNSLFRAPSCDSLRNSFNTALFLHCDSTNFFGIDPLFVNPAASNFHLQPCSPAINAGMNAILDSLGITTDLEGNPRISNEVVDMGPYETKRSLNPTVLSQPACAGDSDGAIELSPNICPPFSFVWSDGVNTGTHTDSLAAGTYVFTSIGANNMQVYDTIVISEFPPLAITTETHDAFCYDQPSGQLKTMVSGGNPAYQYHWDPPLPPVPAHFGLLAGTYSLTVADANGCTATTQATIGSPDPIEYFSTTQNASCINCADGSVVFDSVIGGTNPQLLPPIFNLAPGHYCFTVADAADCPALLCFVIGVTSSVLNETIDYGLKLSPNPTASGASMLIEWTENESVTLRVFNLQGRVLENHEVIQNTAIQLTAHWPPGVYQIELRTESGGRAVRKWVIL
jgi:hypothetical protein